MSTDLNEIRKWNTVVSKYLLNVNACRAFQAEAVTSAKALWQEKAWPVLKASRRL